MAFSLNTIGFIMMSVFIIASLGYLLGRINIKGVSLGTAGVFIIALLYGAVFSNQINELITASKTINDAKETVGYASEALKIIENIGLVLFVTSVGFIAGPNFFKNLKNNFKSYVLLGLVIIIAGGLSAVGCILCGRMIEGGSAGFDPKELTAMVVGLLSGSLTSTPAFSAAKATVLEQYENAVTVGHGIAYLFGVIGVVLFVQIIPKITGANMDEERKKITIVDTGERKADSGKLINIDPFGFMPFSLAAVIGILVGSVKFFDFFSLTTTGGTLLVSLIFGHFAHVGKINITPNKKVLETFRELGLMLFLIGAGVAGGMSFLKYFQVIYFIYGIVMTIIPMIIGYIIAKYVLKMSLLNNLGSITGGMTSTPALGALIGVAGTDDVASAYAATYPVALIAIVIVSQLIIIFM